MARFDVSTESWVFEFLPLRHGLCLGMNLQRFTPGDLGFPRNRLVQELVVKRDIHVLPHVRELIWKVFLNARIELDDDRQMPISV